MGGPRVPELDTTTSNGSIASIGIHNPVEQDNAHEHKSEEDNISLFPDDRFLVNGILSSTVNANMTKGNNAKVPSGAHSRKVVAKRSFSSRYKLNEVNSREEYHFLNSDKAAMITKVASYKNDEAKAPNDKHTSRSLKNRIVEPLHDNESIKESMRTAEFPTPSSIKKNISMHSKQTFIDEEKENMPEEGGTFSSNSSNLDDSKAVNEHDQDIVKTPNKSDKMETPNTKKFNLDPVWFILSGHHVQRREFQAMIKRLRGRICRDSHHWSYQATHFVIQDLLLCRTEKFFAAVAAGRVEVLRLENSWMKNPLSTTRKVLQKMVPSI